MRRYPNKWMSARAKRRHPCEKGGPALRAWKELGQRLLDHRFWARHPAPHSKTRRGAERRAERAFKQTQRSALLQTGPDRDDGWFTGAWEG